jgi:hypothetical protein
MMTDIRINSPGWIEDTIEAAHGVLPKGNDSLIDGSLVEWSNFQTFLNKGVKAGKTFSTDVVSTYSLVYTTAFAYYGGVLAPNGDIHFVPNDASVGQKIDPLGVVSTYSLVYTTGTYAGGVLAPNGDIHFVPRSAPVGQKISPSGVVSTYSLVYTTANAYQGGVLAPNGDIHFVPLNANRGQKINHNSGLTFDMGTILHSYLNKF